MEEREYPLGPETTALEIAERTLFLDHLLLLGAGTGIRAMEELAGRGVAFSPPTQSVQERLIREIMVHLVQVIL
jgi:hypothetical protein